MMRRMMIGLVVVMGFAGAAHAQSARAAETEMKALFGSVPTFFKKGLPESAIPSAWELMKATQLEPGTIPEKYRSLISLAVASQIPCRYCVIADRAFLELGGASEQEINEAVAMSAITRLASTWLNGLGLDEVAFRKEADQIFAHVRKGGAPPAAMAITDAASARKDVQQMFGMVPGFIKAFPDAALPAFWKQMKSVQLDPRTAIPGKYKELIGLGVAAQIPCRFCVYFHTEAARLNGATDAEIKEALVLAATTRYFSTVINGLGQDEASFRREVKAMVGALKKMAKK